MYNLLLTFSYSLCLIHIHHIPDIISFIIHTLSNDVAK